MVTTLRLLLPPLQLRQATSSSLGSPVVEECVVKEESVVLDTVKEKESVVVESVVKEESVKVEGEGVCDGGVCGQGGVCGSLMEEESVWEASDIGHQAQRGVAVGLYNSGSVIQCHGFL